MSVLEIDTCIQSILLDASFFHLVHSRILNVQSWSLNTEIFIRLGWILPVGGHQRGQTHWKNWKKKKWKERERRRWRRRRRRRTRGRRGKWIHVLVSLSSLSFLFFFYLWLDSIKLQFPPVSFSFLDYWIGGVSRADLFAQFSEEEQKKEKKEKKTLQHKFHLRNPW